jgi:hypothetical protein
VNFQAAAVVVDEPQPSKFIHEKADAVRQITTADIFNQYRCAGFAPATEAITARVRYSSVIVAAQSLSSISIMEASIAADAPALLTHHDHEPGLQQASATNPTSQAAAVFLRTQALHVEKQSPTPESSPYTSIKTRLHKQASQSLRNPAPTTQLQHLRRNALALIDATVPCRHPRYTSSDTPIYPQMVVYLFCLWDCGRLNPLAVG